MGIPRFFGWLRKQDYPGVLQDSLPGDVDWLIFDMNSLFHQAQQITYGYGDYFTKERALLVRELEPNVLEEEFRRTLITLMMNVVTRVQPARGILIAVDGVAPQAKIQQQRQRRYKGPRGIEKEEEEVPPELAELRKPIIDVNRITPGTEFMFRLDDFLRSWLKDARNSLQLGVLKIIYSSHLVPGEGEHKYLEYLRSGEIPTTGVHVINGMDADLFILSLISPVDRVFITREDIKQVVNIRNFRLALLRSMKNVTTPADFTLITFFIGNDFLPHQPALRNMEEAFNTLIRAYIKVGQPLTEEKEGVHRIIWQNLLEFLKEVAKSEGTLLANQAIRGFKYSSPPFEVALSKTIHHDEKFTSIEEQAKNLRMQTRARSDYTFNYTIFRNEWYKRALGPRGDTEILEFLIGGEVYPITEERIQEQCSYYLQGLAWNLGYYLDGWNKVYLDYLYPYHHTPLLSDLVTALSKQDEVFDDHVFRNLLLQSSENEGPVHGENYVYDYNAIHQLLAVLPFESQELLPKEVRNLMDIDSPIYDMFPNRFMIDRMATNNSWEGIAVIPYAESYRIVDAVNEVPFPEARWERYQTGNDLIITLEEKDVAQERLLRRQVEKIQTLFPTRRGGRGRGGEGTRGGRGRGEGTRGGRGRGEGTRGRGEGTRGEGTRGTRGGRGRGEGTRGRGEGTRGRGEGTRGRGEGTRGVNYRDKSKEEIKSGQQSKSADVATKTNKQEEWRSAKIFL